MPCPAHIHSPCSAAPSSSGWCPDASSAIRLRYDPIFTSIPDPLVRQRLISRFDPATTEPEWALAYRFDIVLNGPAATPFEPEDRTK
jgi:protocatechuate 3,4-dioxygenase beta subunit